MEHSLIGKQLFNGNQVELTELDAEKDAEVISAWTMQPAFNRKLFSGTFKPRQAAELKKKLQEMLNEADENHQAIYFAIRKIDLPDLIGLLWFPWVDAAHQTAWMDMAFTNEVGLTTYGQDALDVALYYAFMELSLHRLAVRMGSDEPALMNLYEENGFIREVLRRENLFSQGRYLDEYVYAMLLSEWKEKQSGRAE